MKSLLSGLCFFITTTLIAQNSFNDYLSNDDDYGKKLFYEHMAVDNDFEALIPIAVIKGKKNLGLL